MVVSCRKSGGFLVRLHKLFMQISLGFSPCPNDTFIFDAMVHGKIDTEGLVFEPQLEDVETLNRWASAGKLDVTKLSYAAFARLTDQYKLLHAGSALGNQCGPLLIARANMTERDLGYARIAMPGYGTTAWFLYKFAYEKPGRALPVVFSEIETAVLDGRAEAGVIIHENRFTYRQKGLVLLRDLGAHWEEKTGWPIPLGGIVVHQRIEPEVQAKINRVMQRSVAYAQAHTADVMPYVRQHAQEMDPEVMQAHINLYVNEYTTDLGERGRAAVQFMLQTIGLKDTDSIFVQS
jgi:1,4-dihydroxy-6-naphthoate synthase